MARWRNRPRLVLGLALAVALIFGVAGGVVATSWAVSGHAVKSVKVVSADSYVGTNTTGSWLDVPAMAVTMSVPSGTKALFLITFSAEGRTDVTAR